MTTRASMGKRARQARALRKQSHPLLCVSFLDMFKC